MMLPTTSLLSKVLSAARYGSRFKRLVSLAPGTALNGRKKQSYLSARVARLLGVLTWRSTSPTWESLAEKSGGSLFHLSWLGMGVVNEVMPNLSVLLPAATTAGIGVATTTLVLVFALIAVC